MSRVVWDPWPGTATEADLLLLVERDKRLCELIDGTLVEKAMGSYESFLASWLITYLNIYLQSNLIGVVTGEAGLTRLNTGRVRIPDVAFTSFDRLGGRDLSDASVCPATPNLAVEIFSMDNTKAEMQQKTREYFNSGSALVWIVYPLTRTVEIFEGAIESPARVLHENDFLDGGNVLPGFSLKLASLFSNRTK